LATQQAPPVPPHVAVWRSVRVHGDTKTERSRRTLGLPAAAVQALRAWLDCQAGERLTAGDERQDTGLVFTTCHGPDGHAGVGASRPQPAPSAGHRSDQRQAQATRCRRSV
jgi:cytochrome c553